MYHLIEFNAAFAVDVEVSPKQRLERVRLGKGTRVYAYLMPKVVETAQGPMEVADICFEDGSITREVPFEQFRFVD